MRRTLLHLLKIFSSDGHFLSDVNLPGLGSITAIGGKWDSQEAFFGFQSFTVPPSVYMIDFKANNATELWARVDAPAIDPSAYEVKQVWFASKDGTKVPMFVFHKKGLALNGKNPTLLTGYGGFNISLTPSFAGDRYLWLEHGGVFAVANLRGGSELGEEWHRAGMLDKKQNVFDDFIAAAEYLIAQKYTDKDHLAIRGGIEWRIAGGSGVHAASGVVSGGGLCGAVAGYVALPAFSNCQVVDSGVWLGRGCEAV